MYIILYLPRARFLEQLFLLVTNSNQSHNQHGGLSSLKVLEALPTSVRGHGRSGAVEWSGISLSNQAARSRFVRSVSLSQNVFGASQSDAERSSIQRTDPSRLSNRG